MWGHLLRVEQGLHGTRAQGKAPRSLECTMAGLGTHTSGGGHSRCKGPVGECAWLAGVSSDPLCSPFPFGTHNCLIRASGCQASGDSPQEHWCWEGLVGSASILTVNRPLVLLRLPMKNRAPRTDRVAGKGMSAILKTLEGGFRAMGEQTRSPLMQKGQRAAP